MSNRFFVFPAQRQSIIPLAENIMTVHTKKKEKKYTSLQAKVFRAVLMGSLLLGTVSLLIGLAMYSYGMMEQYISESFGLAITTANILQKQVDVQSVSRKVMEIYRTMDADELEMNRTDTYRAKFSTVQEEPEYWKLIDILEDIYSGSNVSDIYVAEIDPETHRLVYICDPDRRENSLCMPGDWDPLEDREFNKYMNWDFGSKLYDIGDTERYGYMLTSGFPLTFDDHPTLFVMVDVTLEKLLSGMRSFAARFAMVTILIMLLLGWIMSRRMNRTLVNPINRIAQAAREYVKDRREGSSRTDHFSSLNIETGDEIENLGRVMAEMEYGMTEYERDLTRATAETERFTVQMTLAERIQREMLPKNFEDFEDRPEFDLFAVMEPAMEVGGDFYDFYMLDDDHLVMTMADVSGKGIPAALFMMAAKIKIEDYVRMGKPLSEVMKTANEDICAQNIEEMFVTVWLAVLELSTGRLKAVNAGHEFPAIKKPGGAFELFKDPHSFVIGGMAGMKYKEYELVLEPGTVLFVYTDGVPEAADAKPELFGTERMLEALNREEDDTPVQLLIHVRRAVQAFAGDEPQSDDLTMLCLRYHGPAQSA